MDWGWREPRMTSQVVGVGIRGGVVGGSSQSLAQWGMKPAGLAMRTVVLGGLAISERSSLGGGLGVQDGGLWGFAFQSWGLGEGEGVGEGVRDGGGADGGAGVAGEVGFGDGDAVDEELAVDDGAAEVGVGGDIDDGSWEQGGEFGGDVATKGGVRLFVDFGVVGVGADGGGSFGGRQMAGVGIDNAPRLLAVVGQQGGTFEGAGCVISADKGGQGLGGGGGCRITPG